MVTPTLISMEKLLAIFFFLIPTKSLENGRAVKISNNSPSPIELSWVHPDNGALLLLFDDISSGEQRQFNTFVGHQFQMRELPDAVTGECAGFKNSGGRCRERYFVIKPQQSQEVTLSEDFRVHHLVDGFVETNNFQEFNDYEEVTYDNQEANNDLETREKQSTPGVAPISYCHEQAKKAIKAGDLNADLATKTLQDLVSCVEQNVTRVFEEVNKEVVFESDTREAMSAALENYTCADQKLPTTAPMARSTWVNKGVEREVKILHDRETSKIHVLKNFISSEECDAIEKAAAPTLHIASVADGKGGSQISNHRKAMQAGVKVPWEKESEGNPIALLSRRVYDYANDILGLDLKEAGQEDLMSIQYFGRGEGDNEPDQYRPHCDGDCGGLKHRRGGRIATMVMYCSVPEQGGATNFQNAGVHVKPEFGSAAFFSSVGSDKIMDSGFTQHSGCPVVKGDKKIAVQWLRLGVDEDNPWDSFNTLGVQDDEDC